MSDPREVYRQAFDDEFRVAVAEAQRSETLDLGGLLLRDPFAAFAFEQLLQGGSPADAVLTQWWLA